MRSSVLISASADTPEPFETSTPSLDRLDDQGIDDLYHRTMREYARTVKRQQGVFV